VTPINDDTAVLPAVPAEPAAAEPDEDRDDSLAAELAKAAPRRWWNRGTLVLGALALLLGGFLGGLQVQKHYGTTTAAANRPAGFTGQNRGAGGYPNFAGGAGQGTGGTRTGGGATASAAPAGTTGTVKLVDGDTIYLTTADGTVVTVKTTGRTSISTANKGTLKDLRTGDSVTVQGAAGSDGTVSATSVTATGK
jgi:hypothetical protein